MRKYFLSEIDRMRQAIRWRPSGTYYGSFEEHERYERWVEDRLRTYMLNGTDPEELEEETNEKIKHEIETFMRKNI